MRDSEGRVAYFDVLNVISCISVVCLHCNGYIHTFNKDEWWWFRVLIEVVCYFAVPVFYMLSGATLLNYRERYSTDVFYRKRFLRTLIPFIFWGCLFYGLYLINHADGGVQWTLIIKNFMEGHIPYTAYWFFIPLFLLYIFMPFLSLMVLNMSEKLLLSLGILLILFQSILPTIFELLGLTISMALPIAGYFIFALLGYLLSKSCLESNKYFYWTIAIIAVMSLIVRYYLIFSSDTKNSSLFTYFGLYSIFPALLVFLSAKKYIQNSRMSSKWAFLSKRSYGVYLIHVFIITIFVKLIDSQTPFNIVLSVAIVYTISVCVTFILQKTPFTKFLLP